jgi:hypothetical protein
VRRSPPYQHQWIESNKISKGERLKTANGTIAVVVGGTTPKRRDGWMWDLTVPGNNDHDFYVVRVAQVFLFTTSGHTARRLELSAVMVTTKRWRKQLGVRHSRCPLPSVRA